jgi:hypothetical protein
MDLSSGVLMVMDEDERRLDVAATVMAVFEGTLSADGLVVAIEPMRDSSADS